MSGSTVTLTWTAPAGVTTFVLEAGSATGLSNLGMVPMAGSTASFSGVPVGTYFVRVRSVAGGLQSGPSNEVTVVVAPLAVPGPPLNFTVSVIGSTVTLVWSPPATGGPAASYIVEAGTASGASNVATLGITGLTMTASNVPAGTYYLRVRAANAAGRSAASTEATAIVAGPQPPGAPGNLGASVSGSTVSLAWTPPTSGGAPSHYLLEAGSAAGAANIGSFPVTPPAFSAGGVPNGQYFVRVRAVNSAGVSAASNEVSFLVGPAPVPGAPQALSVFVNDVADFSGGSVPGQYSLNLSWIPPAAGTPAVTAGYVVEVGTAAGQSNVLRQAICNAQVPCGGFLNRMVSAVVTGGGVFYVRLRAANGAGESAASNQVVVSARQPVGGIPVSGEAAAALTTIDNAMTAFMAAKGITAGAIAVSSGSRVYVERAYGWRNGAARTEHLRSIAPFRLASVSKPITAAIIQRLAAQGKLSLTDRAFCTGANQPCRLTITPFGTPDSRLGAIVITHLLEHEAGWDRDISGDPMFNLRTIATQLGLPSPISKQDIVRWLAGRRSIIRPGRCTPTPTSAISCWASSPSRRRASRSWTWCGR